MKISKKNLLPVLIIVLNAGNTQQNAPCDISEALPLPPDSPLFENGSIFHGGHIYPQELQWQDGNTTFGCFCKLNDTIPCLVKCCEDDELLSDSEVSQCVLGTNVSPGLRMRAENLHEDVRHVDLVHNNFRVFTKQICPGLRMRLQPEKHTEDNFTLFGNGSLLALEQVMPQGRFCVDWDEVGVLRALVCIAEEVETAAIQESVYRVGVIVSIPFLVATFMVYAIIPELRNLYGMTLMCYVGCLIAAYGFTVLSQTVVYHGEALCTIIAFIIHFSFLSSFFWLNVMCFDIWWTFGGFRALQGSVKQREKKKFLIYSIYAWGCASIITSVSLIMDFVPGIPESYVKPRFGHKSCWFPDDNSKAVYFYGPMGVTVVCNIVLFVSTALKILRHKRDTATHLKTSESRRHDDNKQWFNLYLKLFIVMGISWSMEIISWLLDQATPQYIWYLTDLANTLQGVVIFIIFVWKAKIRRLLIRRFGCQKKNFQSGNSTRSGYHSSASNKTCTSIALHDKIPNDRNRINTTTDESDCV